MQLSMVFQSQKSKVGHERIWLKFCNNYRNKIFVNFQILLHMFRLLFPTGYINMIIKI